ncbi:MAG TPA: ABC-type transport auxiliary lipoprotein family protein [Pelomicrobium sp.]|nr:ABC-type transport auxiliary lipoprotein family protein [Pelomicrobium sp.]
MKTLAAALAVLLVAGCSLTREEPVVHYVLRDGGAARSVAGAARPADRTLVVAGTVTDSFYDTTAIAFSREEGKRGAYQYAFWTERPGRALHGLLVARLAAAGLYAAVVPSAVGLPGDLELQTEVHSLYHDVREAPGVARVRLTATLVDRRQQRLLARRTFAAEAPASAYSAAGAVDGFNAAVRRVLDDLVVWLREIPPR